MFRSAQHDNSSIFARGLLWLAGHKFNLIAGKEYLTLYQFHTNTAKHYSCKLCGIYPFHKPRVAPDFYGINVACLEDVDTFKLEPGLVDGGSYE